MVDTYTYGTTPSDVIVKACKGEPYTMRLIAADAEIVKKALHSGIDSHLEAAYVPDRGDSYEWNGSRLVCSVSPESLAVLLRRLGEMDWPEEDEYEDGSPHSLRSGILQTLDIEEV